MMRNICSNGMTNKSSVKRIISPLRGFVDDTYINYNHGTPSGLSRSPHVDYVSQKVALDYLTRRHRLTGFVLEPCNEA